MEQIFLTDININKVEKSIRIWKEHYDRWNSGAVANVTSLSLLQNKFKQGNFIFAYYKDEREFKVEEYKNIEKIEFKDKYSINETPGIKLTKYLVDLKATQAFTKDREKAEKIDKWFGAFENILKTIFDDAELQLIFNEETKELTAEYSRLKLEFSDRGVTLL